MKLKKKPFNFNSKKDLDQFLPDEIGVIVEAVEVMKHIQFDYDEAEWVNDVSYVEAIPANATADYWKQKREEAEVALERFMPNKEVNKTG